MVLLVGVVGQSTTNRDFAGQLGNEEVLLSQLVINEEEVDCVVWRLEQQTTEVKSEVNSGEVKRERYDEIW